jgi:hypothetical protein
MMEEECAKIYKNLGKRSKNRNFHNSHTFLHFYLFSRALKNISTIPKSAHNSEFFDTHVASSFAKTK